MPASSREPPAIAVVGCGAITEVFHLPALARDRSLRDNLILVDRDPARAALLGQRFGITETATDLHMVLDRVDGAIVAVPPHLHHTIILECLRNGLPALSEKPLATSMAQVDEILAEVDRTGVPVAVNNTRRLFPSARHVKELIASGKLGPVESVEYRHGEKFDWPSATDSYFGTKAGSKGVLLDTGVHVLDLVCWWLDGKPDLVSYEDDSLGGTEAVAELTFERDRCRGTVRLSWLSKLKNTYRVRGSRGSVEGTTYDSHTVTLVDEKGARRPVSLGKASATYGDFATPLIENFLDVVRGRADPLVSARDAAASLQLIEECYARRSRFDMPWHDAYRELAHG